MNNTLIHIDAHSDLYGNKNRNLNLLSDLDMACDNYVWYGIRDGFISQIYWVVPEGLYDLSEINIAERFVSKDLLVHYEYIGDRLEMSMSLITRSGEKTINYTICAMDKLPSLSGIELVTVATSPEFTPESSDLEIFRALKLLGASEEDMNRIKKFHEEMMAG